MADLKPINEALTQILAQAKPAPAVERIPLVDTLGRVVAEDQVATLQVPPRDNSAMDGYVLRFDDIAAAGSGGMPVSQRIAAGEPGESLLPQTAARIFTGAEIPPGADTVVMQEDAEICDGCLRVKGDIRRGQHIRPAGQDIALGATVVPAGHRLRPQDIGVLASIGVTEVPVYRPLRVAVISTGDELVEPGQALQPGQIYNSNRYTLTALLTSMGCEVLDGGIAADDPATTRRRLQELADSADVVLSSGGVSVGEEDHVRSAVESLGELSLWKLNIKPGKPLAFGSIHGSGGEIPFIGLPGNPSSVFVTFVLIAHPYLARCQGQAAIDPVRVKVKAEFEWLRRGSRMEFLRARVVQHEGAEPGVRIYANQSSGALMSASWANALVELPPAATVKPGDRVSVILLSELI